MSRMMRWMGGGDSKAIQFLSAIPRLFFWCWCRVCVCLVYTMHPDVHTYLWDHFQELCLTWAAFLLKATLSHGVFWFYWFIIFTETSLECGEKKSPLLVCSPVMSLMVCVRWPEMTLRSFFHFCAFNPLHTKLHKVQWHRGAEASVETFTEQNYLGHAI